MQRRTFHTTRLIAGSCSAALALVSMTRPADAKVDLGVGLIGSAGGNFLDKPDRNQFEPDIYPGYGGLTLGGGLLVDVRFLDELLGLELDVIRSTDKGKGDLTFTSPLGALTLKHTLGQSSWHLPLLLKLTIKSPVVAPQFFVGPEFVFPSEAESTTDPPVPGITATADNYVMITGGGGIEIKLPLPVIDLRIPIGLRFSYNPSVPSAFADRVTATSPTTAVYHSEWKYAASLTLGAALFF